MTRHNPLESSIGHPDRWELGQRLIYVSSGVTERCKSEMLTAIAGSNAVVIPMSSLIGALDLEAIARSAHEVWILHGEAACNPAIQLLLKFRQHSIPVSESESLSVLHAPELGTVRIFDATSANANLHRHLVQLFQQTQQALALNLPDHEYDELLIDTGRECIQLAVERAFH